MAQPVSIDHDNRRITFQLGRIIPVREARADLHRLLDLALDALEVSKPPAEPPAVYHTGTYPDGDPRNSVGLPESFATLPENSDGENQAA